MITMERVWTMPSHRTFTMPPVKKLIKQESAGCKNIIEPFPFQSKIDVFDYLQSIPDESADLALVDPPYTRRQVSEHYKEQGVKVTGWHTSSGWTTKVKREVARKIKPGGKAITFGYDSAGLHKKNGMQIYRILLCHSGVDHYDLICTCDRKIQTTLEYQT